MDIRYEDDVASFAAFLGDLGLDHVELRAGYLDARPGAPDVEALRAVAREHDLTYTVHAPHVDVAPGNVNDRLRAATVAAIQDAVDLAAALDAGGVVVHGGTARSRYPAHVRDRVRERSVRTIQACAEYAADEGVPLCLENQRDTSSKHRHTATPDRLAAFLDDVGVESLRLTLDVGHAKATDVDYRRFVDRFGDRIHVAHLHDNDGESDAHDPLPSFREVAADIDATYNVLEMKSRADVKRCVGAASLD
jgi:sugar phosphate isomerase/epimerase